MAKRKNQPLIDSDSDSSGSDSGSDLDAEFLSLPKKTKTTGVAGEHAAAKGSGSDSDWGGKNDSGAAATSKPDDSTASGRKRGAKKMSHSSSESDSESGSGSSSGSDSSSSSDDDDDDVDGSGNTNTVDQPNSSNNATTLNRSTALDNQPQQQQQAQVPQVPQLSVQAVAATVQQHSASASAATAATKTSDAEDGEVHSSGNEDEDDNDDDDDDDISSSCESQFNDGFDDNLMGDADDRARLESLTEKEREQEIFKRIEERDRKRTHWEIKRKLRLKAERERDTTSTPAEKKLEAERKMKRRLARQARAVRLLAARAREAADAASVKSKAAAAAAAATSVPQTSAAESTVVAATAASHGVPTTTTSGGGHTGSLDRTGSTVSSASMATATSAAASASGSQAVSDEENWDDEPEFADPKERSKERKKTVEANRTDDKRSNAMAMLKAKREGKMKRDEEEAKRLAELGDKEEIDGIGGSKSSTTKLKASDVYSDDSGSDSDSDAKRSHKRFSDSNRSDSDSDSERDPTKKSSSSSAAGGGGGGGSSSMSSSAAKRAQQQQQQAFITTKEELNKIRLSRHKIERFVALPHFDRVVAGCFVRISIGNKNNQPIYRVAEVAGVVETAKIYMLGKCRTNKGLRLRFGSSEKVFRLEFLSNQDFSDTEFEKWREVCSQNSVKPPQLEFVERKVAEIKEAIVYEFKDEDVHRIIEEKNRFRKYPTNYAMKKTTLMKERDAALLRGEDDLAADINVQIEELDDRANELDKRRSSTISLISYINDRNRKRNVQAAEMAIMEEVRASKGVRTEDPFTRRSTKPTMTFKAKDPAQEIAAAALEAANKAAAVAASETGRNGKKEASKALPAVENNLYSLHDFEIDLEVVVPVNPVTQPKPVTKSADSAPKRSLNLEAYKKKRGLI